VSQIMSVGLKLIPVALVGKIDDGINLVTAHEPAHAGPAALAFGTTEFWQAEAALALLIIVAQILYV
jgi:hypothetical protein